MAKDQSSGCENTVKIVYSREMERRYPTNPVENADRVALPAAMLGGSSSSSPWRQVLRISPGCMGLDISNG
ncbi:hypothetical protein [Methanothrix sp.]|uniref:hypothetical protein n=1 Tax=Methanothrix sp. TaxID=90426 RepID=UPI0025FC3C47|nr:hypothetical protein [Methanothrix sp.]